MAAEIRVLYVDDEPDLLTIGKLFLEESGDFTITTAPNAAEALRLLEQEKFDAIVSDYQMPEMDGIQFLVEVRTRFGPTPFILFTGRGREEVVIQAINSGADFYLQKGGEPGAQFAELSHKIKQAGSRNKAEDLLRKSEEKYRQLIEHSNEAILVAQDGMLKLVNYRLIELLGYSEQELLSIQFPVFIHPDDRAMVVERYQKRLTCEEFPSRYSCRLNTKDGNILWVEISAIVIDWDGHPATLNFLTDITERKRAEVALLESRDRSDGILASLDEAIFLVDPSTRLISMCNNATTRIFGYSNEELVGRETNFLHIDQAHFEQFGRDAITAYEDPGYFATEFEMRRKDGSMFPSEHFVRPIRDPDGRIKYVVNVVRDITERKRAEEKLLEAKARTTTVLEGIADTFYSLDDAWRFTTVNPAAEKAPFGRPASEMLGKVIWELYPGLVGTFIQQHYIDAAKNFSLEHYEGQSPLNGRWYEVFMHGRTGGVDVYMRDISKRKLAEDAQRESEKKYHSLVDSAPIGIGISDLGGNIHDSNPAMRRITGYSLEEFKKVNVRDTYANLNDRQYLITRLQETGEITDYEVQLKRKDGTLYYALLNSRIIEINELQLILITTLDITERKHLEEKLLQSEAKHRTLVETTPDILWEIDTFGNFVYLSPQIKEILGYSSEDLMGKSIFSLLPPESISESKASLFTYLQTSNRLHTLELPASHCDGRRIIIEIRSAALFDHTGKVTGFRGIARDISERKNVENELFESKRVAEESLALFRTLNEHAPVGFAFMDAQYRFVHINETMAEMNGLSVKDHIGKTPKEIIPGIWPLIKPVYTQVLKTGTSVTNIELSGRTEAKPNEIRFWIGNYYPVKTAEQEIIGIGVILIDITERKLSEKILQESEERFRSILASIDDLVFTLDENNIFVGSYNPVISNLYVLPEEFMGKSLREVLPKELAHQLQKIIEEVKVTGKTQQVEYCLPVQGKMAWFNAKLSPRYSLNGTFTGVTCVARDITERKQSEEALRESEEKYRALFAAESDGIFVVDKETGTIIDCNDAILLMYGYRKEEAIGQPNTVMSAEPDATRAATQEVTGLIPIRYHKRKDGSVFPVEITANIVSVKGREMIVTAVRDITARKHAEDALTLANKKLTLLSSIRP